jgi:hypothetical protein
MLINADSRQPDVDIPFCYWLEAAPTKYRDNPRSGCGEAFRGSNS